MSSCWNEKITTKRSYRNHTSLKFQSNCAWGRWSTKMTTRLLQSLCNRVPTFSWLRRFRQGTIIGGHDHVAKHIVEVGCDGNHYTKAQGEPGGEQLLPQACICESCEPCNMSNFINGFTYFWGCVDWNAPEPSSCFSEILPQRAISACDWRESWLLMAHQWFVAFGKRHSLIPKGSSNVCCWMCRWTVSYQYIPLSRMELGCCDISTYFYWPRGRSGNMLRVLSLTVWSILCFAASDLHFCCISCYI